MNYAVKKLIVRIFLQILWILMDFVHNPFYLQAWSTQGWHQWLGMYAEQVVSLLTILPSHIHPKRSTLFQLLIFFSSSSEFPPPYEITNTALNLMHHCGSISVLALGCKHNMCHAHTIDKLAWPPSWWGRIEYFLTVSLRKIHSSSWSVPGCECVPCHELLSCLWRHSGQRNRQCTLSRWWEVSLEVGRDLAGLGTPQMLCHLE